MPGPSLPHGERLYAAPILHIGDRLPDPPPPFITHKGQRYVLLNAIDRVYLQDDWWTVTVKETSHDGDT